MVKSLSAGVSCPAFFLACQARLGKRGNIPSGETVTRLRSRGATRPRFAGNFRTSRKERAQGMPDARCTRGLVCKIVRRNAHEHTGSAEAIRHSLRDGFTAYIALSSETNSSCLRRRRVKGFSRARLGSKNLRRLDTSNGCQDHTVLPYASTSLVLR